MEKKNIIYPWLNLTETTLSLTIINHLFPNHNLKIFNLTLIYGSDFEEETDILSPALDEKSLQELQTNPRTILIIDCSAEGWIPFYFPKENYPESEAPFAMFNSIYFSCSKHNIDLKQIIYFSSNLKDNINLKLFCKKTNNTDKINIFTFIGFKFIVNQMLSETKFSNIDVMKEYVQHSLQTNYKKSNLFTSLSRITRLHRVYANYQLYKYFKKYTKISNDKITDLDVYNFCQKFPKIDENEFRRFATETPFTIDTTDFYFNHATELYLNLTSAGLIDIVLETEVESYQGLTLFFSEKTFKPIARLQPFIIFGQKGCHRELEKQGFQLYHELFNYNFDDIDDPYERFNKILKNVLRTVKKLKNLPKDDQIKWRLKLSEKYEKNFYQLQDFTKEKNELEKILKGIDERFIY